MTFFDRISRISHAGWRRYAFCTVATRDFLPWALVLFDSIARHHPDARRVLLYVAREGEIATLPVVDGVHVIATSAVVAAEREADLRRRYTIPELCFALKPALLAFAMRRHAEHAVYLDSDIDVLAPLNAAAEALAHADVLLTPHLDAPVPMDGKLPSELTILRAGACNLGFVAVRDSGPSKAMLAWWGERIARWGYVAPESGYQGDQKWMDLALALFPGVQYLRDVGSNVGCWNLHSRPVRLTAGKPTVKGHPLSFFHFSGFDPDRPEILSKYQNRIRLDEVPAVAALAKDFAARLVAARARAEALRWTTEPAAASPGAAVATHAPEALADEAYRASFAIQPPAGSFATGESIVVPVRVTNASPHRWPVARSPEGAGGIALSWHVRREDGEVVSWENTRYFLGGDLAPGQGVDVLPAVRAPDRTGRYLIEFDVVHEGTAWFSSRGSETARVPLFVGLFDGPPG